MYRLVRLISTVVLVFFITEVLEPSGPFVRASTKIENQPQISFQMNTSQPGQPKLEAPGKDLSGAPVKKGPATFKHRVPSHQATPQGLASLHDAIMVSILAPAKSFQGESKPNPVPLRPPSSIKLSD